MSIVRGFNTRRTMLAVVIGYLANGILVVVSELLLSSSARTVGEDPVTLIEVVPAGRPDRVVSIHRRVRRADGPEIRNPSAGRNRQEATGEDASRGRSESDSPHPHSGRTGACNQDFRVAAR